jgi:hypothetical protein
MREVRRRLLELFGQRNPNLYAIESLSRFPEFVIGAFGVRDARPAVISVDCAGLDGLDTAETVSMNDRALEKVGYGRKTNVRMRTHVDP